MVAVLKQHPWRSLLVLFWLVIVMMQPAPLNMLADYAAFSVLGVTGAVFANATGAGGGVVFVPFFHHLGLTPMQIVATSFAIQCCGMSAGALTWWHYYRKHHGQDEQWQPLTASLLLTVPCSIGAILLAQWGQHLAALAAFGKNAAQLHIGFGLFSIMLALAILGSVPLLKRSRFELKLSKGDCLALPLIAFIGGLVTAWLSVGVGELVAVYLIIRRFNITMSIAVAVMLSALTVWAAVGFHIVQSQAIIWPIVLFAGAGAVIGGIVAKRVVLAFNASHLKIFFGVWVLLMGLAGLPVF